MAGRTIANKTVDMSVDVKYSGKYVMLEDVTAFKLPGVEYGEGEITGAGLAGAFNNPDVFNIAAMEASISSRALQGKFASVFSAGGVEFRITWAVDKISSSSAGAYDTYMAIVKGKASKLPELEVKKGEQMELETTIAAWYYKLTRNGTTLFEFDVLNQVVIINGVNYSAKLKAAMGK